MSRCYTEGQIQKKLLLSESELAKAVRDGVQLVYCITRTQNQLYLKTDYVEG